MPDGERPYQVAVVPDVETALGDPTIDAALHWLTGQSCHSQVQKTTSR